MRFVLERVSGPEIEPVTLAEMKRHLKTYETVTTEDDDITSLIVAAREWVEDYTGRALIDQTWRLTIDQTGALVGDSVSEIMLRKAPVLAITAFKSVDSDGVETAIDSSTYALREADSRWPRLVALSGATWGVGNFRVTFRAGFADRTGSPIETASVVPERFKFAIKLWAESLRAEDTADIERLQKAADSVIRSEKSALGFA